MLEQLNERQLEAVYSTEGPMLVVAGAGSGKTRVLTTKIAHLIQDLGVYSGSLLAITFTNKAAKEMKERVAKLLDDPIDGMWIGTFHSVCVRILRMGAESLGYSKNFTIYDRDDQRSLMKEVFAELGIKEADLKYSAAISVVSDAKNKEIKPEEFWEYYGNDYTAERYGKIYQLYEKKKSEYNAFDFDDLIIKAVELLKKDQNTLDYYMRKFKYIFVDEYQDTNRIQYELVKLLSGYHQNICVVGDSDQSIYGWRGADIGNILDFERDFPGAKVVLLEENYRSTGSILEAANRVIRNNEERMEKALWTGNEKGDLPIYKQVSTEDGEVRAVIEWIDHLCYGGESLSEMAILYRSNAQSRAFEEALVHSGIPYVVVGGLKFYDRKEIKDILAYLRVITNPSDDISLKRVINEPRRGIGTATIAKLEEHAAERGISIYGSISAEDADIAASGKALTGIKSFVEIIESGKVRLASMDLTEAVKKIVESTGIVGDLKREGSVESRSKLENIESFISSISSFTQEYEDADLEDYLASVSLMSDVDRTDEKKSGISLMTIHAAKGLEFGTVFLTGLEEGLFPSSYSSDEGSVEEERRLFYVAATRAKKHLFITSTTLRRQYGKLVGSRESRFIGELENTVEKADEVFRNAYSGSKVHTEPTNMKDRTDTTSYLKYSLQDRKANIESKKNDEFKIGDKVKHKVFGIGIVITLSGTADGEDEITISFEKKGIKKLRTSMAPIEVVK